MEEAERTANSREAALLEAAMMMCMEESTSAMRPDGDAVYMNHNCNRLVAVPEDMRDKSGDAIGPSPLGRLKYVWLNQFPHLPERSDDESGMR